MKYDHPCESGFEKDFLTVMFQVLTTSKNNGHAQIRPAFYLPQCVTELTFHLNTLETQTLESDVHISESLPILLQH